MRFQFLVPILLVNPRPAAAEDKDELRQTEAHDEKGTVDLRTLRSPPL